MNKVCVLNVLRPPTPANRNKWNKALTQAASPRARNGGPLWHQTQAKQLIVRYYGSERPTANRTGGFAREAPCELD
jgi:hypothetical protein